jgi:hypothetical protein
VAPSVEPARATLYSRAANLTMPEGTAP